MLSRLLIPNWKDSIGSILLGPWPAFSPSAPMIRVWTHLTTEHFFSSCTVTKVENKWKKRPGMARLLKKLWALAISQWFLTFTVEDAVVGGGLRSGDRPSDLDLLVGSGEEKDPVLEGMRVGPGVELGPGHTQHRLEAGRPRWGGVWGRRHHHHSTTWRTFGCNVIKGTRIRTLDIQNLSQKTNL